jgi:molybdenum cofactor cytidylyltransferase
MGRSKATLELGGQTFLERVVGALVLGGCDPVLVSVAESEVEVRTEAEKLPVRTLVNPDPGEGPITSLRMVLARLGPEVDGLVWLPLDHALVTPEIVRDLIEHATTSGALLTLPTHGSKRGHPALFRRELFAELGDPELIGGARTVVHRHLERACLVDSPDRAVIEDIDTPEVYERVRNMIEQRAGQGWV